MRSIYFLFGISFVCIIHTKTELTTTRPPNDIILDEIDDYNNEEVSIVLTDLSENENNTECQNVTCLNDTRSSNCDGEIPCENNTEEITTPVPTKRPKKKDIRSCPPLPLNRLRNGKIVLLPNEKIRFVCYRGYQLAGPSIIRCFNGKWTSTVKPMCKLPHSSCNPPEKISHGIMLGEQWTEGSRILYICDQGYSLLGSRERICENGVWSSISPICQDESEPMKNVANRLKNQFVDKVGSYSSDSRARAIGSDIKHTGLELILLIDRSSSVDPVDFKQGIEFAKFLVNEFGVENGLKVNGTGTRIAVITFGDKASVEIKLDDATIRTKKDAIIRLDSLKPEGGGTAMQEALAVLIGMMPLLRPNAKQAIFLLTDGHNNVGDIPPSVVAKDLKATGIEIFTVGIGRDIDKDELTSIASEPARNHVFILNSFSDLSDIMWLIRNSPTIAPPAGPGKCGFLPNFRGRQTPEAVPDWPWLAIIYVKHPPKGTHATSSMGICSGILICSQWVLTSAGCFYGEDETAKESTVFRNVYVTLGEDDLTRVDKTEKNFRVSRVLLHPNFLPWSGADDDVALLKLSQRANLDLTYRPICLPTAEQSISITTNVNHGSMAGWGAVPSSTFFEGNFASAFTIFPRVTKMPLVEDSNCKRIKFKNATNTFCAGSKFNPTCSGNLGSPLVVKDVTSNFHYVIGVLSRKKHCHSYYNTFSDISRHTSWINKVTDSCQDFH